MTEQIIHKSFRYRIYPTKRQIETLERHLSLCAELYNAGVQERRDAWKLNRVSIDFFSQSKQLPEIKLLRPDLAEINAQVLEDVLKRVKRAFDGFFRRVKRGEKAGYPRFKSFRQYDSLTFRQIGNVLQGSKLRLSKIGFVKIKRFRTFEGKIKELHIKRECGHWFAIFSVETMCEPLLSSNAQIGVDVGLTAFATLSDGSEIANPRYFKQSQAELRRAQRRVARRKRGSHRRRKAVTLLAIVHQRIRRQRADFHHNVSRWLVNNFGLIAIEDLNAKGLARGILSKSVNDAGWSAFFQKLTYKAANAGRELIKVD